MVEQILPNNNESAIRIFPQNISDLNTASVRLPHTHPCHYNFVMGLLIHVITIFVLLRCIIIIHLFKMYHYYLSI
jgi:hypothetical protein